jgi:hypothetical protein
MPRCTSTQNIEPQHPTTEAKQVEIIRDFNQRTSSIEQRTTQPAHGNKGARKNHAINACAWPEKHLE